MAGDEDNCLCAVCSKMVFNDDLALQCEGNCAKWHHNTCLRISKAKYDQIVKLGDLVSWFCSTCKNAIAEGYVREPQVSTVQCNYESCSVFKSMNDKIADLQTSHDKLCKIVERLVGIGIPASTKPASTALRSESSSELTFAETLKTAAKHEKTIFIHKNSDSNDQVSSKKALVESVTHNDRVNINGPTRVACSVPGCRGTDGEGFSRVCYHRKSKPNSNNASRPKSGTGNPPKLIAGKNSGSGNQLLAVKKQSWVYVTRFQTDTTAADIKKYLETSCGKKDFICEKLPTRHSSYNSFKIGVPHDVESEVMKPDLWPVGILIGKFFPSKQSNFLVDSVTKNTST